MYNCIVFRCFHKIYILSIPLNLQNMKNGGKNAYLNFIKVIKSLKTFFIGVKIAVSAYSSTAYIFYLRRIESSKIYSNTYFYLFGKIHVKKKRMVPLNIDFSAGFSISSCESTDLKLRTPNRLPSNIILYFYWISRCTLSNVFTWNFIFHKKLRLAEIHNLEKKKILSCLI